MIELPDPEKRKSAQVRQMFDRIAPTYDFLNHLLSLNIDKRWRKKAIAMLSRDQRETILDIATGTGDLALEALKQGRKKNWRTDVTGLDFAYAMMSAGKKRNKFQGFLANYFQVQGDAQKLPFLTESFKSAMISFGIRNVESIPLALSEVYRVLQANGRFLVLEFSQPKIFLIRVIYNLYFHRILPFIGNLISRDKGAYDYLPKSVAKFPTPEKFISMLKESGFERVQRVDLSFGIASLYIADKS